MNIHYQFVSMAQDKLIANWESINDQIEKYREGLGDRVYLYGIEATISELKYPMTYLKKSLDKEIPWDPDLFDIVCEYTEKRVTKLKDALSETT